MGEVERSEKSQKTLRMLHVLMYTAWEEDIPPLEGSGDQLKPFDTALHDSVKLSHEVFIFEQLANWAAVM